MFSLIKYDATRSLTVMISIPVVILITLGRPRVLNDSAITRREQARCAHCCQVAVQKFLAVNRHLE